jgi:hypothetical protein
LDADHPETWSLLHAVLQSKFITRQIAADNPETDDKLHRRTNLPADAGDLVGHGNECDVWVTPLFKLVKPLPHTRLLFM